MALRGVVVRDDRTFLVWDGDAGITPVSDRTVGSFDDAHDFPTLLFTFSSCIITSLFSLIIASTNATEGIER